MRDPMPLSPDSSDAPPATDSHATRSHHPSPDAAPDPHASPADQYATALPATDEYATIPSTAASTGAASRWPSVPGYEILGELGRGGMGVVYKARQVQLKRVVALKMILAGGHAGAAERERFRTEAEAIARLLHPNIVQIYEIGEHADNPFFSLEFCPGGSLDRRLKAAPLQPRDAARLVQKLADAMDAAHRNNVVHRDLKPANVLLVGGADRPAEEWQPKVTDFGLARKTDEAGQTLDGVVMGTPSYMAPEQADGMSGTAGPLADVYALGAILYECLTGRPPFKAATSRETIRQVVSDEPVLPRQLQPSTPIDLETIALKCLQKRPEQRYATAANLSADLDRYLKGEPIVARRTAAWERCLKYAQRKPWVVGAWATAVAALLFLVAGGGYYLYRQNLDLEAVIARDKALEVKRVGAEARLSTADAAQQKRDWAGVVAAATDTETLVRDEPELADLLGRARRLRTAAENVVRFTECRDLTLFHAVLALEEGNQKVHRSAAQEAAREGLALFGLTADGPPTLPRLGDGFAPDTERWLKESCYELYLTWAQTLSPAGPGIPKERAGADEALLMLDRAFQLGLSTTSYHRRRAELLQFIGDMAGAQKELGFAGALAPSGPVDHFLLGMELSRTGDLDRAADHLTKVLKRQPEHFWASYFLAGCHMRLRPQRFERALAPLTACIQMKPTFVWPYLLRGFVRGELRDFEAAFADFEIAEKLAVNELDHYGLLVNRAVVRMRQGIDHEDRARGMRERNLPGDAEREIAMARPCYDQAASDLQRAVALRDLQPQAYANLAEVHLRRGNFKEALLSLGRAIALAPSAANYRMRARLREKEGDYAAALPDLEEAIQRGQALRTPRELAGDQLQRGRILLRLRKYEAALDAFDKTLTATPELWIAHQLRGEALLELGRFKKAVADLDVYQAKGIPSAVASRARALARAKLGNYAGAIEDYTRALEIDRVAGKPPDPLTLAFRGWAYLIQEAPKLALRDFDEALRLGGKNQADCYAGRGYARMQLGPWQPAISDAEASINAAINEGNPVARTAYNTARIYALAAAKVYKDPEQQHIQGRALAAHFERTALHLLRSACEHTPDAERAAFWRDYVDGDPALRQIAATTDFAMLRNAFKRPVE